jgi:SGNH hydrolase-like domain, acetyltransferase AlgX
LSEFGSISGVTSKRLIPLATGLAYLAAWLWSLQSLTRYWDEHRTADIELAQGVGASFGSTLLVLRILILAASAYAGLSLVSSRNPGVATPRALRTLIYCGFAALIVSTSSVPLIVPLRPVWPVQSIFLASLGVVQTVWAFAWRRRLDDPRERSGKFDPPLELIDLVVGNALAVLLLLEVSLSVWGWLRPSPLVFHESVTASLEAHRQPAHRAFYGGRLNRSGFADDDFESARSSDDLMVAVVGDSFGLGVVPVSDNYVNVAERALREMLPADAPRIALNNYGVPAVGLPEYAELLRSEVRLADPSLVVISVFVGNDIHEGLSFTRPEKRRYCLQQWLVWKVAQRAITLLAESRDDLQRIERLGSVADQPESAPIHSGLQTPITEEPTFSETRFLEIERSRMVVTQADDVRAITGYEQLLVGLRYFERALGESLVIAIIPDEFQVNDALWHAIGGEEGPFERDLPQRRILEFCKRHEVACIDLLPALRAAEESQPTYHLRDTHWNRYGNRVAGIELARGLRSKLATHPSMDVGDHGAAHP